MARCLASLFICIAYFTGISLHLINNRDFLKIVSGLIAFEKDNPSAYLASKSKRSVLYAMRSYLYHPSLMLMGCSANHLSQKLPETLTSGTLTVGILTLGTLMVGVTAYAGIAIAAMISSTEIKANNFFMIIPPFYQKGVTVSVPVSSTVILNFLYEPDVVDLRTM